MNAYVALRAPKAVKKKIHLFIASLTLELSETEHLRDIFFSGLNAEKKWKFYNSSKIK